MAQFSRRTILAATPLLAEMSHAGIEKFALEVGLEKAAEGYSKAERVNAVSRDLLMDLDRTDEHGENVADEVVTGLIGRAIKNSFAHELDSSDGFKLQFSVNNFQERYPDLHHFLGRDGYSVDSGELRRMLPVGLDLPKADDDVHALLDRFHFDISKGHLDQGIRSHVRGDWASANSQLRTFVESLLDEIAGKFTGCPPATGHQRRQFLANVHPPVFLSALNEWSYDGKGFIEGFLRRLHPAGSHPGLSDEEDSTFRLHLVLLVSRLFLRRLK